MARSLGIDVRSGAGLAEALVDVDVVVDATSTAAQRRAAAEGFFAATTATLLAAEQAAGVGHHVLISIVGVDEVGLGYYRGKREQERRVESGAVPWSILRTTQFHDFARQALDFVRVGPLSLVPAMPARTIAVEEVATALVDLAEAGPSGRVPDLAGPEDNRIDELARRLVDATGSGRRVIGLRVPGPAGRAIRSGALRPHGPGPRGTVTFDAWLRGR